jgi:hypothetical protein
MKNSFKDMFGGFLGIAAAFIVVVIILGVAFYVGCEHLIG